MSDYAVKNLLEIDDSFGGGGDIEARFSRKYIDSEELGVSLFRYAAGKVATDGHHHREQEEAYRRPLRASAHVSGGGGFG
jgi:hypothetical protein